MPASGRVLLSVLLLLSVAAVITTVPRLPIVWGLQLAPPDTSSALKSALEWLVRNQSSDGSYGGGIYVEHWTSSAANALWLNESRSTQASLGYGWLSASLKNSSSWYWGSYGEADIPGVVLYSIAAAGQTSRLDPSRVASWLLQFQQSSGGFNGYYDARTNAQTTSALDTASALLGLSRAGELSLCSTTLEKATNYLFTLQNRDGSFNLTRDIPFDPLYSLGPDPVSLTAFVTLALGQSLMKADELHLSSALHYLANMIASSRGLQGHGYAASLSALAFDKFDHKTDENNALEALLREQRTDGGFRDRARAGSLSNALDTGWAALALENGKSSFPTQAQPLSVGLSYIPQSPDNATPVHFNSVAAGGTAPYAYHWSLGDGLNSTNSLVSHIYQSPGNYEVTLTVTDNIGVSCQTSEIVFVRSVSSVLQPQPTPQNPQPLGFSSTLIPAIGGAIVAIAAGTILVLRRNRWGANHLIPPSPIGLV